MLHRQRHGCSLEGNTLACTACLDGAGARHSTTFEVGSCDNVGNNQGKLECTDGDALETAAAEAAEAEETAEEAAEAEAMAEARRLDDEDEEIDGKYDDEDDDYDKYNMDRYGKSSYGDDDEYHEHGYSGDDDDDYNGHNDYRHNDDDEEEEEEGGGDVPDWKGSYEWETKAGDEEEAGDGGARAELVGTYRTASGDVVVIEADPLDQEGGGARAAGVAGAAAAAAAVVGGEAATAAAEGWSVDGVVGGDGALTANWRRAAPTPVGAMPTARSRGPTAPCGVAARGAANAQERAVRTGTRRRAWWTSTCSKVRRPPTWRGSTRRSPA